MNGTSHTNVKKYDVLAVMDTNIDMIIKGGDIVPRFRQEEQFVGDYVILMGGSAGIFLCQTAKLGLKTIGVGVVGDDAFGRIVIDTLKDSGVSTEYVKIDKTQKTGMGVALCKEDDRAMLTYCGTNDAVIPEMITDELLNDARHLHIASYYLTKKMQKGYLDIVKRAKKYGMSVSIDTNFDPEQKWKGIHELLPYTDIFMPNEQELLYISERDNEPEAVQVLLQKCGIIVVKKGKSGAALYTKDKKIDVSIFETGKNVVDAIGAGDSFDGGFIYAYLKNMRMEQCLKTGVICGGYNTTGMGGTAGQADWATLQCIIDVDNSIKV